MELPPVYHHTGLENSGGATRVARLLNYGLKQRKHQTNLSFELAEKMDGTAILPEDFGRYMSSDGVAHLHTTSDWARLLGSIRTGTRTIITMHDCELFTGGCPYPLDCPKLDDCADPCPRNFPDSARVKAEKIKQIERLDPIVTAPSRWMARLGGDQLGRRVTVIPNGIPWPARPMPKNDARKKLGINPAARVVMFAAHGGMSAAYKSGDLWRDIWKGLEAKVPQLVCFAVGGDKESREGNLVIWPYVDRRKLTLLMAAADALLYPTRADNHSMLILEAMSRALPVVSYHVGGVPEQVMHLRTGILVPPGDQAALVEHAAGLLRSPGLVRKMGQEAFSFGRKRFSRERMLNDYIRLYSKKPDRFTKPPMNKPPVPKSEQGACSCASGG